MPQRPSEPSSRPNRGEAREALIAADRRLFAERGYKATTTREIATEAGVSHALLRYHFSSKEGLRDAVDENVLGGSSERSPRHAMRGWRAGPWPRRGARRP
ncbi:helix-turn-helix domain-containing protein [Actinomadura luteofluorescens]|uniref:helix-turn-helix domain-containing protein n=1 Tax=Actinomadura luteofluorescens TaxID=46163 RepID=UPI0036368C42